MIIDCFPFFNELDILEVRLNELSEIVDRFVIVEAAETYGGHPKPYHLTEALAAGRFDNFRDKLTVLRLDRLEPECTDRTSGREREAYQRNQLMDCLRAIARDYKDVIIFSDCDEIPSAAAINYALDRGLLGDGIHRFKQSSYYYNVQTLVDYGHDFASRARIGYYGDLLECGSLYKFRMARKNTTAYVIEYGGWHFSYFGGPEKIKTKVAALSSFLSEYKLFGDEQLTADIARCRDLHHRRCEMPEVFTDVPNPYLPRFIEENRERFAHFFRQAATV